MAHPYEAILVIGLLAVARAVIRAWQKRHRSSGTGVPGAGPLPRPVTFDKGTQTEETETRSTAQLVEAAWHSHTTPPSRARSPLGAPHLPNHTDTPSPQRLHHATALPHPPPSTVTAIASPSSPQQESMMVAGTPATRRPAPNTSRENEAHVPAPATTTPVVSLQQANANDSQEGALEGSPLPPAPPPPRLELVGEKSSSVL